MMFAENVFMTRDVVVLWRVYFLSGSLLAGGVGFARSHSAEEYLYMPKGHNEHKEHIAEKLRLNEDWLNIRLF